VSFRVRLLALVAVVAVIAIATTAWLTLRQASQQVTESADAERADVDAITEELREYGWTRGTWEGVAPLVEELGFRTGQRIRLVTEFEEVLADTDTIEGRTARPVGSPPISINPRPSLALPDEPESPEELVAIATEEIDNYRSGVLLAACLTRLGLGAQVTDGPYGVPRHAPDAASVPSQAQLDECRGFATVPDEVRDEDFQLAEACWAAGVDAAPGEPTRPPAATDPLPDGELLESGLLRPVDEEVLAGCLTQAFANQVDWVAPVPLRVYLGAVDDTEAALSTGPVLTAAGLVALLALAGSLLVSRRVLRPIRALTSASQRLGAGDLTERVPVVGRDELAGLASSFNRMADSLQRGEERQRRLVADVAHELRTPLANLRGYLEALKDGVVSPDPELFSSLHDEAVLQQRIVDDLQELALAEAGALVYHRSRVDLGELLETCQTAHQAVAEAADVRLTAVTTGQVWVHADPDRLRQVLGNLVGNALRASTAGGSVTITGWQAGGAAMVTVADTGSGIAPEHQPYLFDRFWRADAARGRNTGGSGLGLAIARQIVTDHGGTIKVASELGAGTIFTIRLPVDPS
jgi:two-component system sensor histidine kinase BaeS